MFGWFEAKTLDPKVGMAFQKNVPKNSLTLFPYMLWSSGENFSNFEAKSRGLNRFAWDILKFHFCPEIYERSSQIPEMEIVIIFLNEIKF